MKKYIIIFVGFFILIACKKEKFENEGVYTGEFVSSIHYQDSIYHTTTHVMVELAYIDQFEVLGIGEGALTIDGNTLEAGMYLYTLIVDDKEVDTKRLILQQ